MKEIQLSQGKVALVDDEDYERVSKFKWYAHFKRTKYYVETNLWLGFKKRGFMSLHNYIMYNGSSTLVVDHKDGNTFNNCKSNLRLATRSQNTINSVKSANRSSIYKGIHKTKYKSKKKGVRTMWLARIIKDYKHIHIGMFDNEIDAAKAYDKKAIELFGEFALPNFSQLK